MCHSGDLATQGRTYDLDRALPVTEVSEEAMSGRRNRMQFNADDQDLRSPDFIELAQKVWPGDCDPERVQEALARTIPSVFLT